MRWASGARWRVRRTGDLPRHELPEPECSTVLSLMHRRLVPCGHGRIEDLVGRGAGEDEPKRASVDRARRIRNRSQQSFASASGTDSTQDRSAHLCESRHRYPRTVSSRRAVRVDQAFFDDLDLQLGSDRGPNGEPSSTDFIVIDLPTIVDEFADNFDALPFAYPDRPDYRVLVVGGALAAASVVIGQLVADGSIVLLGIELDLDWPDEQLY